MIEAPKRATKVSGYSAPEGFHEWVAEEAKKRDMSASQLIRHALELYVRVNPSQPSTRAS